MHRHAFQRCLGEDVGEALGAFHGDAELLERHNDRLLGVSPDSRRTDHTAVLHPGDTLLLYTDGLIERRDETLSVGLRRLGEAIEEACGIESLDQLCHSLCDRLVPDGPQFDDVCLLAFRFRTT